MLKVSQRFSVGDRVLIKDGFHKELQPGRVKEIIKRSVIGVKYIVVEDDGFKTIVSADQLKPVTGGKE